MVESMKLNAQTYLKVFLMRKEKSLDSKINIPEYYVSEFNKSLKDIIESNYNYVRIRGEISEIKPATKGQLYLTLKDEDSILSGVIWDSKKRVFKISNLNLEWKLSLQEKLQLGTDTKQLIKLILIN